MNHRIVTEMSSIHIKRACEDIETVIKGIFKLERQNKRQLFLSYNIPVEFW